MKLAKSASVELVALYNKTAVLSCDTTKYENAGLSVPLKLTQKFLSAKTEQNRESPWNHKFFKV